MVLLVCVVNVLTSQLGRQFFPFLGFALLRYVSAKAINSKTAVAKSVIAQ
ncbi:MAG: hypothetical protein ACPHLK_00950 [Gammaproteobacteria bacterium]|jgi:hypothetical protein